MAAYDELVRKVNRLGSEALAIVQTASPYKTGRLRASFVLEPTLDGFKIYTDLYYMRYTTETWLPDFAKGRRNPHENWFLEATEYIVNYIESRLNS